MRWVKGVFVNGRGRNADSIGDLSDIWTAILSFATFQLSGDWHHWMIATGCETGFISRYYLSWSQLACQCLFYWCYKLCFVLCFFLPKFIWCQLSLPKLLWNHSVCWHTCDLFSIFLINSFSCCPIPWAVSAHDSLSIYPRRCTARWHFRTVPTYCL